MVSMIKRLFGVRSAAGDPLRDDNGAHLYFNDKTEAKVARDAATAGTGIPHHVAYGPDHRWYRSECL